MSLRRLNYAKYGYRIVRNEQDLIANLDGSRLLFNNFDWNSVSEKTNITGCEIIIVYEDEPALNHHPGANNKITLNQVQRVETVCDSSQLAKRFNFMDVGHMYGIFIHGITSEFSLVHFEDLLPFASESLQLANCAIAKGPDFVKLHHTRSNPTSFDALRENRHTHYRQSDLASSGFLRKAG